MPINSVFVNFSGTSLETGSRTVNLTVLCGVSGGVVIPVQVNGDGSIVTA